MVKGLNRLAFLRKSNIMSQREVAQYIGVSQPYYARLEKHPEKISVGTAIKLKKLLNVNAIEDLLDEVS